MAQPCHGPASLGLSREEAWVLHAAVVRRIERERDAGRTPEVAETLRERIETTESLDTEHLDVAERALSTYLDDAPERDAPHAQSALDHVRVRR